MALGTFSNIGYLIPNGDATDILLGNPVNADLDFGADDFLVPGEVTTIQYTIATDNTGNNFVTVVLTGAYSGTDDLGSAYMSVLNVDVTPTGTVTPGYIGYLQSALLNDIKISNSPISGSYLGPGYDINEGLPICFAAGTLIATPSGEQTVESLKIGDKILTADSTETTVMWIGRQTVSKIFWSEERCCPVLIRAGALGEGMPHTDLVVTADHGMLIDGIIAHAGSLVNGTSIVRVPYTELAERMTYYHIETEGHEVVLANGTPAETFVDNVTRRQFDNYAEYQSLYGDGSAEIVEMPLARAMSRRQLPQEIRQRLADRAVAIADTELAESA